MRVPRAALAALCIALPAAAQERPIPPGELRSGTTFLGAELRAQQDDEFANPGMLWVERGARLWRERAGDARKACADCHGDARASMKGVAARYPAIDRASGLSLIHI